MTGKVPGLRIYTALWILLDLSIIGDSDTCRAQEPWPTERVSRLAMEERAESTDQHFVIYNTESIMRGVTDMQSGFNISIVQSIIGQDSSQPTPNPVYSCTIHTPSSTCLRFGQNGKKFPNFENFMATFSTHGGYIEPKSGTESFNSFCNYAQFNVYKEEVTDAKRYITMVYNFCSLRDLRDSDTDLVTDDEDAKYHLAYETDPDFPSEVVTTFGLTVQADKTIKIECGLRLPPPESPADSEPGQSGEISDLPSNEIEETTESMTSAAYVASGRKAESGGLSTEMIILVCAVCLITIIAVVLLSLLVYCFRKRKVVPPDKNATQTGDHTYERSNTGFTPAVNSYEGLPTNPTDGNIYEEISNYENINVTAAIHQSNGTAVTSAVIPPLQSVPSINSETKNHIKYVNAAAMNQSVSQSDEVHNYIVLTADED